MKNMTLDTIMFDILCDYTNMNNIDVSLEIIVYILHCNVLFDRASHKSATCVA